MVRIKSEAQLPPYMRFPRFLLDAGLPANAVLTYMVLLDRTRLSITNQGWKDLMGDVFIYYPLEELAETLHCSIRSITTALQQLSDKGLIERVRLTRQRDQQKAALRPLAEQRKQMRVIAGNVEAILETKTMWIKDKQQEQ